MPQSRLSLVGVPWDASSSFMRGAAAAPPRIREALWSESTNSATELGVAIERDTFDDDRVEIIKGSADFEKTTLTDVIEARAKATSIQLKADDLTPEKMAQFEAAQQQLSGALSRLMVTVERYPDLKTTSAFRDFQAQYEGMENRIGVERRKFNELAQAYNAKIKRIPNSFIAGFFGFKEKPYFKAQEGTENAPDISFSK